MKNMDSDLSISGFEDIGAVRQLRGNFKTMGRWLVEHSEFSPEPIVALAAWPQKIIENGLRRARAYIGNSILIDTPDFGDNYPNAEALAYARVSSRPPNRNT